MNYLKKLQDEKIKATKGSRVISNADSLFEYIDSDFKNWKTNEAGKDTKEANITIYEMERKATLQQMFESLSPNLDALTFTQSQIIEIVKNKGDSLLQKGYANFFLFKVKDEFFVARVYRYDVGWRVRVFRLSYDYVCYAEDRFRVVVSQLTPSVLDSSLSYSDTLTLPNELVINGLTYIKK